MTTATITTPKLGADSIDQLDYVPICQVLSHSTGDHCDQPCVAYIEFHRVNSCTDEECNSSGNMEGNVCQEHLDFFMDLAVQIANSRHQKPRPFFSAFPGAKVQVLCATCRMPIRKASDILKKVVRL